MEDIEIPSHFLCPISLQLMRDPVTISTGITYDRESIERWIFTCKNATCPITKQELMITDHDDVDNLMITPNHTLRRLIQSWCTLHASDGIERIPTPRKIPTVDRAYVNKLLSDAKRSSGDLRYASLQKIRSLVATSDVRARKLLESSGVFRYVAGVLVDQKSTRGEREESMCVLSCLESDLKNLIKNEDHESLIDSLITFLRSGNANHAKESAIMLLNSFYSKADPNQLANPACELFDEVINLVRDQVSLQATKHALKLLIELNPWGRNRVRAVEAGAVRALVEFLVVGSDRRACELALIVLDQVCGCAEGRAALVGHGAGLALVSKKILRVSHVASDRAVRILLSISKYAATGKVVAEMMEVGVVAKLCLVIQVDCSSKTKERAKEILRLHSRAWRGSPCIPPHLLTSYPSI